MIEGSILLQRLLWLQRHIENDFINYDYLRKLQVIPEQTTNKQKVITLHPPNIAKLLWNLILYVSIIRLPTGYVISVLVDIDLLRE